MNKIGYLIAFFIFLVVAIIYDCVDSNRRNEDREKYDSLEKRLMEYVNENDFKTAYKIMEEEGMNIDYVPIAEIEYMIKNKDFIFALNISKDRLKDEGYYANSVLENLINIYHNGGEEDVIKAMSLINYPLINNTSPRYWAGIGYSSIMRHWSADEINEIHSKNNNAIKKFLMQLEYEEIKLSKAFKKVLISLLLPSTSYEGNNVIYNYDEVNEIIKKYKIDKY